MRRKKVVHIGPAHSRGGISAVIKVLTTQNITGWKTDIINTHTDEVSIFKKINAYFHSKKELQYLIQKNEIDLAHIHVTHSVSWLRKRKMLKICLKNEIPVIMHIHSGRFDEYCNKFFGLIGRDIKKNLNNKLVRTVLLEERWIEKLSKWIPKNSLKINNPYTVKVERDHQIDDDLTIIMLARNDKIKGHLFAMEIISKLNQMGVESKLIFTGIDKNQLKDDLGGKVMAMGWVEIEVIKDILKRADFLISPSEFEGSSISVINSMACGLPCIVSSASSETLNIPDLVIDNMNSEIWAKKIVKYHDKNLYNEVVKYLEYESKKYSPEKIVLEWEKLYDSLVK